MIVVNTETVPGRATREGAASTILRMSHTARSSPVKMARDTTLWPMFNSSMRGNAATGTTFS